MELIKTESENGIVQAIQIEKDGLKVWFDVYKQNDEITGDWNKYIFDLKNSEDLEIRKFQENSENYSEILDLAIAEYEKFEEFTPHGSYTISNSGGYLIELSPCGDSARVKESWGGNNPQISDWLEIEYIQDEEDELIPTIDPNGYDIPLNMVMRLS